MSGDSANIEQLETFWNCINEKSRDTEKLLDPMYRRFNGCYFTHLDLAKDMVDRMFEIMTPSELSAISEKKFLEPCVGTGNFVIAYLKKLSELKLDKKTYEKIIDNIYVSDVSSELLSVYKENLSCFVRIAFDIHLNEEYFETHTSRGLLFDLNSSTPRYIRIEDVFPNVGKFDIIITNPPYKNLKAESDQFSDKTEYEKTKEKYGNVKKMSSRVLKYSVTGVLNLYKLFTEEIYEKYGKKDCIISLLIPNTLLSDKTCQDLRTRILETGKIYRIDIIRENNPFIDAQQGLCTLLVRKGSKTDIILINKDYCENNDNSTAVSIDDIMSPKTGNSIMVVDDKDYSLLRRLRSFRTVSDFPFIHNMRGELDLTMDSKYIVLDKTDAKLIRGKHISMYAADLSGEEYVLDEFTKNTKKKRFVENPRIVCQQVSNMQKSQRIQFAYVDSGVVLANSCNFISVEKNDYGIDLYYLLGLFNSSIINWYFKLTSTNNHINNYEVASFPIPTDPKSIRKISGLVKTFLSSGDRNILKEVNELVKTLFGTNEAVDDPRNNEDDVSEKYYSGLKCIIPSIKRTETDAIISEKSSITTLLATSEYTLTEFEKAVSVEITKKFISMKKNRVLNHTTSKLSELDLEMIKNVPPGGNWKNIPEETVNKSKRLQQIEKSGGRTTLYGRIDYDSPSYTISTYFNRPGNGTFVHPMHDRMISFREAARFQSFKDDYYFTGSKGEILKQIGNAVPPLLSMQIGKKIMEITGIRRTLDLFCGAGGLSVGLKEAGMETVLATDFNESACTTFKVNNPEIPVLCGDITDEETKRIIIDLSKSGNVEMICGGPPCQGFSMAGKRFIDDPRNQLFKHFVDVVSEIKPKIILMENVEGILSFEKGNVYAQILSLFNDLGYLVDGRLLLASKFGVPQKRKRVIIIGTRKDMGVSPSDLYPEMPPFQSLVNAKDVLSDLEKIECGQDAEYISNPESTYGRQMRSMEKYGKHVERKEVETNNRHLILNY